jgi:hypothetical protein
MQSELITRLTMSKSTVSSGLQELQRHQLIVTLEGERRGAQLYQLSRQTGWVLGADIGNTQVLLVARGLDGGQLALRQFTHTGSVQLVKAAADAIAALRQELASLGPLLAIAVALSSRFARIFSCRAGKDHPRQDSRRRRYWRVSRCHRAYR